MCLGGLRCHLAVAQTNGAQNGSLVSGAKDYHLRFALVLSFCATAHLGLSFVELKKKPQGEHPFLVLEWVPFLWSILGSSATRASGGKKKTHFSSQDTDRTRELKLAAETEASGPGSSEPREPLGAGGEEGGGEGALI